MPNGHLDNDYRVRNIADEVQVPNANLQDDPDELYVPIGRVASVGTKAERVSLRTLTRYIDDTQPLRTQIVQFTEMLNRITTDLQTEESRRLEVDSRVQENTSNIGDILRRLASLEGGGTPQPTEHAGTIRYGVRDENGDYIGVEETASYNDLPATVMITFPAAFSSTDVWTFEVDAGVSVQHIWNEGLVRSDEITIWAYDATNRRYSFSDLTPGLAGRYEIAIRN